jgi:hypothetical protein
MFSAASRYHELEGERGTDMKSMTIAACTAAGTTRSRRRFGVLFAGIVTAVGVFSATSTPAFSADSGSVSATVTPSAPACITLDKAAINFPSFPFSTSGRVSTNPPGSFYQVTVSNCGSADINVFGKGTDATNSGQTVTWTLDNSFSEPCAIGLNKFQLSVSSANGGWGKLLSTTDQSLVALGAGQAATIAHTLRMPCTGSGGAGQAMSWQFIYTATLL